MREVFAKHYPRSRWQAGLAVIILAFFLAAVVGIISVKAGADREGAQILEQNIRGAAVECYAVEGRYPQNLQYLEDHYGLVIDHKHYAIYFGNQGENLVPDIRVIQVNRR